MSQLSSDASRTASATSTDSTTSRASSSSTVQVITERRMMAGIYGHMDVFDESAERFSFHKRNQGEGETVAQYVAVLKKLSEHCEFGAYLEDALRDRFVCGLKCEAVQKRLLTEDKLTFKKAVEHAVSAETAARDVQQLSHSLKVSPLWEGKS
ncbi:hypothetical protein SRHO_G00258290 [Serrasalmus rhombeus]